MSSTATHCHNSGISQSLYLALQSLAFSFSHLVPRDCVLDAVIVPHDMKAKSANKIAGKVALTITSL
jgi:hypothetical protein